MRAISIAIPERGELLSTSLIGFSSTGDTMVVRCRKFLLACESSPYVPAFG